MTQFSQEQMDGLKELINIGLGRSGGILNAMLSTHIELSIPTVEHIAYEDLPQTLTPLNAPPLAATELDFHGDFTGAASLIFPLESAAQLTSILTHEEQHDNNLNLLEIDAINEVGNIILNSMMGTLSNILQIQLQYGLPCYSVNLLDKKPTDPAPESVLLVKTNFSSSEHDIQGHILILFEVSSFAALTTSIDNVLVA